MEVKQCGVRDILIQATDYIESNLNVSREEIGKTSLGLQFKDNIYDATTF